MVWVQEEPANMGALSFVMPRLRRLAKPRSVRSVKLSASPSPATGSGQRARSAAKDLARAGLHHSQGGVGSGDRGSGADRRINQAPVIYLVITPQAIRGTGIAGGIGFHRRGGVDDKGCALRTEKESSSITQVTPGTTTLTLALPGVHGQVLQVARVVPLRVLPAVLLAFGIEVAAGALEVRRFARPHRVNVEAMHAGRKV